MIRNVKIRRLSAAMQMIAGVKSQFGELDSFDAFDFRPRGGAIGGRAILGQQQGVPVLVLVVRYA